MSINLSAKKVDKADNDGDSRFKNNAVSAQAHKNIVRTAVN